MKMNFEDFCRMATVIEKVCGVETETAAQCAGIIMKALNIEPIDDDGSQEKILANAHREIINEISSLGKEDEGRLRKILLISIDHEDDDITIACMTRMKELGLKY